MYNTNFGAEIGAQMCDIRCYSTFKETADVAVSWKVGHDTGEHSS